MERTVGMLDRFERGIERVVNGAFAKAFRSQVEPVELAGALRKEADARAAVVSRGRTLTANSYTVELSSTDFERLTPIFDELKTDLRQVVGEHAVEQGYSFVGPVTVELTVASDLDTGVYRVLAGTERPDGSPAAQPANRGGYDPISRANPIVPEAYEQSRRRETSPAPSPAPNQASPARPAGRQSAAHFTVSVGSRSYRLGQGSTIFGRSSSSADIVIDDPGVSRRHFEVTVDGSHAQASDLGSTNGTLLDGKRISKVNVTDGTVLQAGDSTVVFHRSEAGS
ncbi:DUF3662 and FHA domain-containing protein [Brevibacterium sp. HMSC24B04]|uniref:DUF3662 and FHA domain-containing protein n=1 Tax=Brevibacterium sp. HMSC24B04 TaxID=1581060 RepID=UPI0009F1C7B1|nr:DUF3662 and FHA domain-containing protein [Brevibacterium sp. HMSC24B04]